MLETYQHCIFVCSNYTDGTRTGLHFLYNETNLENVMEIVQKYVAKEGVAFYFLTTDSPKIASVQKKDKFFKKMEILDGAKKESFLTFNNAINNQITAMDIALLLLCKKNMTLKQIKTYLFYIYCIYANSYNLFPFKESYVFDTTYRGVKKIDNEFADVDENDYLECIKPDVIMSKFFNCEGGVELMNKVLKIVHEIDKHNVDDLSKKIEDYFKKCKRIYKIGKTERRHPFALSKKSIKSLEIQLN